MNAGTEIETKHEELIDDKQGSINSKNEELEMEKRKEQVVNFIKSKADYIPYVILSMILFVAYRIRTSNLELMKDAVTGTYVPIDPDSFLFLRYAKEIFEHGILPTMDWLRYIPIGYDVSEERVLVSYFGVYLYKILHFFSNTVTLDYAVIIYPAVAFVIGTIFYYFLIKKLLDWKIALLSSAMLAFIPTYLFRTMSGVADKEALGFLCMYLVFYLYVRGWSAKTTTKTIIFGIGAGLVTTAMALAWGGDKFLFLVIGGYALIELLLNKFSKNDFYLYACWYLTYSVTWPLIKWHGPIEFIKMQIGSYITALNVLVLLLAVLYLYVIDLPQLRLKQLYQQWLPKSIATLILGVIIATVLISASLGPMFLTERALHVYEDMMHPYGNDRWQLTVAENHQPYVIDWISQMGWLCTIFLLCGAVFLFYKALDPIAKSLKKLDNIYVSQYSLTLLYALFLFFFIFSRYSQSSTFNGINDISKFAYLGSLVIFAAAMFLFYFYIYYFNKEAYESISNIDKSSIFIIVWFVIMTVAARSAIRLVMVFAPIGVILASYMIIKIYDYVITFKEEYYRYAGFFIIVAVLLSPYALPGNLGQGILYNYYKSTIDQSKYMGPGYNNQWQFAGKWVRENTPKEAVFGHWWDYGYFVQTGWERATMTDGGNSHGYWNYQMGRHVLTAQNETEALEVLYAHNVTHFLIVADEIGKYTAYSSIGADENYDRYSWITQFTLDPKRTQETRNESILFYGGGYVLDDDFMYEGQLYPRQAAGIGAIFVPIAEAEVTKDDGTVEKAQKLNQPTAALFFNNQRKDIPIECIYMNNVKTTFPKPGLKGCFRIMPTIENNQMNPIGSGLYVSEEGVNALWTNLYLFNKADSAFELVYDDSAQVPLASYYGRQIGPLRIWKINYPKNFTVSDEKTRLYQGFEHENPKALII